jgi:hypothetical protein
MVDDLMPPLPSPTWSMPERMAGEWEVPGAFTAEQMQNYAKAAALAEREACARIADRYHVPMCQTSADAIAQEIRSRDGP